VEIRPITDDEAPAYRAAMLETFGHDADGDPKGPDQLRALVEPGRSWAAFDRGQIVGTGGTFALDVTVPCGVLAMAGLTMVSVRPSHRRRGIMSALVAEHLADAQRRGNPVSGLWASETTIYGRFGYGVATEADSVTMKGLSIVDRRELDTIEMIDGETAASTLPPIYDRVRATRPGMLGRSTPWWTHRRFGERPGQRKSGDSARRFAIARRGDDIVGYVSYRQRPAESDDGLWDGTVVIDELMPTDAIAESTLWRYVSSIDLHPNVAWWNTPVDSVLPWIVSDMRRLDRRRGEMMWLRIADVATTLAARRYTADGEVRIAIADDADKPVFALAVDRGVARCTRVEAAPDLAIDRAGLSTIYLGGVPVSILARAGRARADDAMLRLVDRMFHSEVAPWCPEIF
jgi:predicted acetyltransferase